MTHVPDRRLAYRLRFRDLQLVVALADGSSLRKAAEFLNVTQPALSRTLAEIESAFGSKLFERSSRGLQPTAQGRAAIRGARQLLHELERVGEEVAYSAQSASVIRIGAPPFVAHGHVPDLMVRMRSAGHTVQLKLVEGAVNDLFQSLMRGEVDALFSTYADHVPDGELLAYESLFPSRYVLIAPPAFQAQPRRGKSWTLADLVNMPWVMPGYTSMLRKDLDKAFLAAGVTPPHPKTEATHPFTVAHFVAAGCGLGFVPAETLHTLKPGFVRELRLSRALSTGTVALIYHAGSGSTQLELLRRALALPEKSTSPGR